MLPSTPRALLALTVAACAADPAALVPATVTEDPALPAIELGDARFYLERSGAAAGTPIVFLAGGPGNDSLYLSRLAGRCGDVWLGERHPLILWDQRGTGLSQRFSPEWLTYEVLMADLDRLVDAIAPAGARVILVGHSWGGMYATSFIDRRPGQVEAAVLLEPGELSAAIDDLTPSSVALDPTQEWLNDWAWGHQILTADTHAAIDFYALVAARRAQPTRTNKEEAPSRRLGAALIRNGFRGAFYPPDYDFTRDLGRFSREVLIIAGDAAGGDLGADVQRRYHVPRFPRATLAVIAGAGHTDVAWADACQSVELIDGYLRRVRGAAP